MKPVHPLCIYAGTDRLAVYADRLAGDPAQGPRLPIVMLHGAFHTGAAYLATPDGRDGWATLFARRGHDVYVADWPGHGRSAARVPLAELSSRQIADALGALVREVGPAIVFAHSAAGPMAWWMAQSFSDAVAAIVGIAPGPPANLQRELPDDALAIAALRDDGQAGCPIYSPLDRPAQVDFEFIRQFWANSPRFPAQAVSAYARSIVPESPRVLNERFNIGGGGLRLSDPGQVAQRPILIVTGDQDLRHPREVDARLADYLGADHLWLPAAGWVGNGHMLMSEDNSHEIAGLIAQWLDRRGL
jgi:pimeloyl-ACP methyl ester carboxylesterase